MARLPRFYSFRTTPARESAWPRRARPNRQFTRDLSTGELRFGLRRWIGDCENDGLDQHHKSASGRGSLTRAAGNGSSQTFSFAYSDPNGFTDLPWVQMVFNANLSGFAGCYTHYDRLGNQVMLLNDAATPGDGLAGAGHTRSTCAKPDLKIA
jgi:hypothetical protein